MKSTPLLIALAVALSAVGCKPKEPTDWVKYDVPPPALPAGWKRHEDVAAGFTIDLPEGYLINTGTPADVDATFAAMRKAFPRADMGLRSGAINDLDLSFTDLTQASLKVGVLQSGSVQVKELPVTFRLQDVERTPETMNSMMRMSSAPSIETPAGKAACLKALNVVDNLAAGGQSEAYTHMYYFGREKHFWVIAFTYAVDNAAKMDPLVKQILDSIRFKKPDFDAVRAARANRTKKSGEATEARRKQNEDEMAAEERQRQEAAIREARLRAEDERAAQLRQQQQQQQAPPPETAPPVENENPPVENPPAEPPPPGDASGG